MLSKDAFKALKDDVLKSGTRVKLCLNGFEDFTEIDDAFIAKARPGELESDWVVVVINGKQYDSAHIEEIENQ